jgi:hypothetical protein
MVRKYSALLCPNGVALCDNEDGCFLVLRCGEDLTKLKELLNTIELKEIADGRKD